MKKNTIRWAGLTTAVFWWGVVQAADWTTTLHDGFDGTDFSAQGGLYYRENSEQRAGSFEFQSGVKLDGSGAIKLSVGPMCAGADGCSERAEIWEKTALRAPYTEGLWYGFAVRFGDPIPADDHRYVIAQWKREIDPGADGDFSPFLALRLRNGKLFATVETNYIAPAADAPRPTGGVCPAGSTPVSFSPQTNQMRALVATDPSWTDRDNAAYTGCTTAISVADHGNRLPAPSSGWMVFTIYAKPGPNGGGLIEIFANDKPVVTIRGHIGHADKGLGKNQYFKFGPYRAGHSNEWTMYYDDFWRSPECGDAGSEGATSLAMTTGGAICRPASFD